VDEEAIRCIRPQPDFERTVDAAVTGAGAADAVTVSVTAEPHGNFARGGQVVLRGAHAVRAFASRVLVNDTALR
jgi:hypothetical protein